MKLKFRLDGFDELDAALREIGTKATQSTVLRRALKQAAQPMLSAAKQNAPVSGGALEKAIVLTHRAKNDPGKTAYAEAMKATGGNKVVAKAALRNAYRQYGVGGATIYLGPALRRGASHAHLVEFGTGPRFDKRGKYSGEMPPDPFLRPAFDSEARSTLNRLGPLLRLEIEKTARRAARRVAKRRGWEV